MDLYRYYDADDRLLYVGVSIHAAIRMTQHRVSKPWWNDVVRVQIEHLTWEEAWAGEGEAVLNENPLYNVRVPSGRAPSPPPKERSPQEPWVQPIRPHTPFIEPRMKQISVLGDLRVGERVIVKRSLRFNGREGVIKQMQQTGDHVEVSVKFKGDGMPKWFLPHELQAVQSIEDTQDTA